MAGPASGARRVASTEAVGPTTMPSVSTTTADRASPDVPNASTRIGSRSATRPVAVAMRARKDRSRRSRSMITTRPGPIHAGGTPSAPSARGRMSRRPRTGSMTTRALGDSASRGLAMAATCMPPGEEAADHTIAPAGSAPEFVSGRVRHPVPARSPAGPPGATNASPSRSRATSRPPAIGTTAATPGSGRGSGTTSPESWTRLSVAASPSKASRRRSGPITLPDGAGGVAEAPAVGLSAGVGAADVVGATGAHPAIARPTRKRRRRDPYPVAWRLLARPAAGRGATNRFGGVLLTGGRRRL